MPSAALFLDPPGCPTCTPLKFTDKEKGKEFLRFKPLSLIKPVGRLKKPSSSHTHARTRTHGTGRGGRSRRRPVGRMNSCRRIVTICCARRLRRRGEVDGVREGGGRGGRRLIHGVNSKGGVNYICLAARPCPWSRSPTPQRKPSRR